MSSEATPNRHVPISQTGDPPWEIALLYPAQGKWTEDEYYAIDSSRLVELCSGHIEVLPMPTWLHQLIVKYLTQQLEAWITSGGEGTVLFAPLPVRLFPGTLREPDVLYFRPENLPTDVRGYPQRVDLVMEIVSDSPRDRHRDLVTKRKEYARAGIEEYWIVDPLERKIIVLALDRDVYVEHGVFSTGLATSGLLPDFSVKVDAVFSFLELVR